MKLVYLWVENHKNIEKTGFNFDLNHYFYKNDNDLLEYTLKKNKQPSNFFGDNIKSVTGIIGKNGSGKSGIIEAIIDCAFNLKNKRNSIETKIEAFLLFEGEEDKFYCFSNKEELVIKYIIPLKNKGVDIKIIEKQDIDFLYYDSVFLKKPKKKLLGSGIDISAQGKLIEQEGDIYKYALDETKRLLYFFNKYKNKNILSTKLGIRFPENVYLSISHDCEFKTIEKINDLVLNLVTTYIFNSINNLNQNNISEIFTDFLIFLGEFQKISRENLEFEKREEFIKNNRSLKKVLEKLSEPDTFIEKLTSDKNEVLKFVYEFSKNIYLNENNLYLKSRIKVSIQKGIMKLLIENIELMEIFDYNWGYEMSSGEKNIMNIFSNFYAIKDLKKLNNTKKNGNTIIILLDEPDSLFHPEWQRNFLDLFLKFTEELFSNKEVQIITTSHSPFLASDLPKENIILLENGKELDCKNETFGGNIFEIYEKNYFLDSTFGSYSISKIKKIIDFFTKDKETGVYPIDSLSKINKKKLLEKSEYLLEIIGEKLIKVRLKELVETYIINSKMEKEKKLENILNLYNITEEDLKKYILKERSSK